MSLTSTIAEQVVRNTYANIPKSVISKCKELILGALCCGIAGSKTPIGKAVVELAEELGGNPHSTVIGTNMRTAFTSAAFVNASAINAMDYDDTAQTGHPGSSILSSALALGEMRNCNGRSFIEDNVAWPAEVGLRAALLAAKGYEGSESILDGNCGFWRMAGSDRCNFKVMEDFSDFKTLDISLKPYPCCRWIHT